MNEKTCKKCGKTFPLTSDYFHIAKRNKDGFQNSCKECRNEKARKYVKEQYANNKEKFQQSNKRYYEENRAEILRQHKEYRDTLRERDADKFYTLKQGRERRYRIKHRDKVNAYYRRYAKEYKNTERGKAILAISHYKSRAKFWYGEIIDDFSVDDWMFALEFFDYSCAYCGVKDNNLLQEHVNPLSISRDYSKFNIVPSCRKCNTAKKKNNLDEFFMKSDDFSKENYIKIKRYFELLREQKSDI